jgi:Flp pilus assembly protein TadG
MRLRFAAGVALVGVALMTAGCTRTLDKSGLETQLATALSSSGPALSVDCPDGVKAQAGATFQCTAKDPSGATFSVNVTQTDDKGNVTWTVTGASTSPTASSSVTPSSLPTPTPS